MTPRTTTSVLKSLRGLIPLRDCTHDETLQIAERQASRLLDLLAPSNIRGGGIQLHHMEALPRLRIVFEPLPVSGMSHWNGYEWIISIAEGDSPARQRFTLLHEFKHIIDHGHTHRLYTGGDRRGSLTSAEQAESAADYFAGCALVPRRALKSAWGNGMQRASDLAEHFGVSLAAIEVRLDQTGLARERDPEPPQRTPRCARPIRTPRWQPQRFTIARPGYARRRWA